MAFDTGYKPKDKAEGISEEEFNQHAEKYEGIQRELKLNLLHWKTVELDASVDIQKGKADAKVLLKGSIPHLLEAARVSVQVSEVDLQIAKGRLQSKQSEAGLLGQVQQARLDGLTNQVTALRARSQKLLQTVDTEAETVQ